jgi:hypothetical protein
VQARRSGNDWYVGIMNGLEGRTVELRTADFLPRAGRYEVEIYQDDPTLTTAPVSAPPCAGCVPRAFHAASAALGWCALRFVKR